MYSKVTQEEDNKLAERWQKALEGLLVFVSPHFTPQFCIPQSEIIDWLILCHCRCIARSHNPGPQAQLSGHLGLLP